MKAAFNKVIQETNQRKFRALVIMDNSVSRKITEGRWPYSKMKDAFQEAGRSPPPLLHTFLNESDYESDIREWINNPKIIKDLIVDYNTARGFENDVVFYLKRPEDQIPPNVIMRAKAILVIISTSEIGRSKILREKGLQSKITSFFPRLKSQSSDDQGGP